MKLQLKPRTWILISCLGLAAIIRVVMLIDWSRPSGEIKPDGMFAPADQPPTNTANISGKTSNASADISAANSTSSAANSTSSAADSAAAATAATEPTEDNSVDSIIDQIVSADSTMQLRDKLKHLSTLPRNLTQAQRAKLLDFLKNGPDDPDNFVVKNDIINLLRDQDPPPEELTDALLDIFYDKNADIVMRSYALQHMRPWYDEENVKDERIVKAFNDGLAEQDTPIAGVALLATNHLAEQGETFDLGEVTDQAAAIASNEEANILSRISAVSLCGQLQAEETLPLLRELASGNKSATISLRAAAIASLGELGDATDVALLNDLANSTEPTSKAAKIAVAKLRQKYTK